MKLSTRSRYGVRAMLELAHYYPRKPLSLKKLAQKQELSAKYLEQLLIPLKSAGLVKSVRGAKGGYLLAAEPERINLGQIVRILEGPIHFVDCVDQNYYCPRRARCAVQHAWSEMSRMVSDYLSSITLLSLLEKERSLLQPA